MRPLRGLRQILFPKIFEISDCFGTFPKMTENAWGGCQKQGLLVSTRASSTNVSKTENQKKQKNKTTEKQKKENQHFSELCEIWPYTSPQIYYYYYFFFFCFFLVFWFLTQRDRERLVLRKICCFCIFFFSVFLVFWCYWLVFYLFCGFF